MTNLLVTNTDHLLLVVLVRTVKSTISLQWAGNVAKIPAPLHSFDRQLSNSLLTRRNKLVFYGPHGSHYQQASTQLFVVSHTAERWRYVSSIRQIYRYLEDLHGTDSTGRHIPTPFATTSSQHGIPQITKNIICWKYGSSKNVILAWLGSRDSIVKSFNSLQNRFRGLQKRHIKWNLITETSVLIIKPSFKMCS